MLLAVLAAPQVAWPDQPVALVRFTLGTPILVDARGVLGPNQRYEFQGKWDLSKLIWKDQISQLKGLHLNEKGVVVYTPQDVETYKHGVYQGKASWDRKTGEYKEKVDLILGSKFSEAKKNYFGSRTVTGKCSTDPFLGPAICEDFKKQWSIPSWDGKEGPVGRGLTNDAKWPAAWQAFALAEAQALSQMHKDEEPPPPPPTQQAQQDKKSANAALPANHSINPGAPVPPAASGSVQGQSPEQAFSPGSPVAAAAPASPRGEAPIPQARPQSRMEQTTDRDTPNARAIRQAAEPWSRCLRNSLREGTEVQACDAAFREWMRSAEAVNDPSALATMYDVFLEYLKMAQKESRANLAKNKEPGKVEQSLTGYLRQLDTTTLRIARRSGSAESRQELGTLQAQRSREARQEIRSLVAELPRGAAAASPETGSARTPAPAAAPAARQAAPSGSASGAPAAAAPSRSAVPAARAPTAAPATGAATPAPAPAVPDRTTPAAAPTRQ